MDSLTCSEKILKVIPTLKELVWVEVLNKHYSNLNKKSIASEFIIWQSKEAVEPKISYRTSGGKEYCDKCPRDIVARRSVDKEGKQFFILPDLVL